MLAQGHPVLTRRAAAASAVAACLLSMTALAPAALAAPGVRAAGTVPSRPGAPIRPGARGGTGIGAGTAVQLVKDVRAAWQITKGAGVTVAFVGTGVDPATPGLAGKVTTGPRFGAGPHASKLAESLIAAAVAGEGPSASNPYDAVGIAPRARVLSLQIPLSAADGEWQLADARAIRYAVKHGAQVIYVEVTGPGDLDTLDSAVQAAIAKNVLVIPSGFRWPGLGRGTALFPNSLPGVLTDSAVTLPGLAFSCRGSYLLPPKGSFLVVTPANDIVVTAASGNAYSLCDDAAADAWLTSTAALIKAVFPHLPPGLVARAIAMSARDHPRGGFNPTLGFGMINPVGALRAAASLAHVPIAARPGSGADPAARLAAGPPPGAVAAVRHSPVLLAAFAAAIVAGAALIATAAVLARRRRQGRVRMS
jgi:hypothetical protein